MKRDILRLGNVLSLALGLLMTACSQPVELIRPETKLLVIDRPAVIPPGVLRYCWEEPMVQFEPNGPGLNSEGTWYQSSYIAVREVRQGRWRPCRPMLSEVNGETKNER